VLLESFEAPNEVRQGQDFNLIASIRSNAKIIANLQIMENGALFYDQEVVLQPGLKRFQIPTSANISTKKEENLRRFRAHIIPEADTRLQNNNASAFTFVKGPANILLIENQSGSGANLASALEAAQMNVYTIRSHDIPTTLSELAGYDALILENIQAGSLPVGVMEQLQIFVRDLGKGLLMVGGNQAFGAGGYLRTPLEEALPVNMDVKNKDLQANLALILAVDKSGSMGRCHCDNPDLTQSYSPLESGQAKVDIAKEAVMRSATVLGDQDYLGVIAFDSQPRWAIEIKKLVNPLTLEKAIASIHAEGQTNIGASVQVAYEALRDIPAKRKHIILLTDGWVQQGDLINLVGDMKDEGITLSVVAAGEGSAEYLESLAKSGGGQFYPASNILNVPDIFLKETIKSTGEYIIEEPFYPLPASPSPILQGLNPTDLPALFGYNGTTAKKTARLDLLTPRGDPLLASWQYGLGRSAAWTSDLKSQWAADWIGWEGFPRFTAQLVSSLVPKQHAEELVAATKLEDGYLVIELEAFDQDNRPRNFLDIKATIIGPNLETRQLTIEQAGSGIYRSSIDASLEGTYLIRIGVNDGDQSLGQLTLGAEVPYSPEYNFSGIDYGFLASSSAITGGGELTNPSSQPLLILAALIFPIDVAIRRVKISKTDFQKAVNRIQNLKQRELTRSDKAENVPSILTPLFQARQRVRDRHGSQVSTLQNTDEIKPASHLDTPLAASQSEMTDGSEKEEAQPNIEKTEKELKDTKDSESLTRLLQAKKRAYRK